MQLLFMELIKKVTQNKFFVCNITIYEWLFFYVNYGITLKNGVVTSANCITLSTTHVLTDKVIRVLHISSHLLTISKNMNYKAYKN